MPIIDTDVHESFDSVRDLVPYLPEPWAGWIAKGAWRGFSQPFCYTSPGNGNRADVTSGDGSASASDYDAMRRHVFEAHAWHGFEYFAATGEPAVPSPAHHRLRPRTYAVEVVGGDVVLAG